MSHTFQTLKLSELTIDPAVQRQLDPRRVHKLVQDWDPKMVGVITVSRRCLPAVTFDGPDYGVENVVLDGQTRVEAAKTVNPEGTITCQVFADLSTAEEAAMFLKHNDRKAVTPRDRFRLAVVAEDESALAIRDLAASHGWYVQGTPPEGVKDARTFTAIGAVEKVYALDEGRALKRAFDVIEKSWGRTGGVVTSETVYGIGLLFAENPVGLDAPGLIHKLSKIGLNRYLAAVADRRRTHPGMSIRTAAAQWTVDLYNRGRRIHRV